MRFSISFLLGISLASLLTILAASGLAITTEQERVKIAELTGVLQTAGQLYNEGKFAESAKSITQAQLALVSLLKSGDDGVMRLAKPIYTRLVRAHGLLELEGAELELLPSWEELTQRVQMPAAETTATVSFKADIAPWLIEKCGNCHINNQRGQFSLASFQDLLRGAKGAQVLFARSATSSRIVDVIESGDMPRGGGKVAPEQLTSLKKWIDEGAKFDGPNPAAQLSSFVEAKPKPANGPAGAQFSMPTGAESVSFSRDVAPLLTKNCQGCHIAGQQASGGLRMDNFAQFFRGGDSGSAFAANDANDSLLVKKLKGQSGDRMPAGGRPPLTDEEIGLISTWVREGAKFDGPSPDTNIGTVVNQAWASAATHIELFQRRQQRSQERWSRVQPNEAPSIAKSEDVFVIGNVPPASTEKILQQLTKASEDVKKQLKAAAQEPLLKGGLIVFVLKSRYDYSEFGRMSESRELPKDWYGHWHADPLDVYGVLAADAEADEKQAEAVALQVVAGAYLGSFRQVPMWFAEGVARNLVKTTYRRGDARIATWQSAYPAALLKVENSTTLLEGRLDEESAGLVGMGLTGFMMDRANRRRYEKLIDLLRAGQTFDAACTATFAAPDVLVKSWLGK